MGHMKWISTLNSSDLESMKSIIKIAEEGAKEKASFQGSEYEITYLQNVVNFLETSEVSGYLADLEEEEELDIPSFEDTMNLVKEQQKEEK
tara:strand:+ start:1164 stop:1436 length:273 start_codon:yes stop_codon:yes gene_type:complete